MSVLDNFTEEILQSELPKTVLLDKMIRGLDTENRPVLRYRRKSLPLNPICTDFCTIIRQRR